jgi:hypothetical protein
VDVGDDTSAGNGGLDEEVEFLVTADGELKVAGSDSAHLEVLGSVAGQFEDLSSEVLQDGSSVDGCGGADSVAGRDSALEESVDPAHGELQTSPGGLGLSGSLRLADFASLSAFSSFSSFASHLQIIITPSFEIVLNA